LNKKLIGAIWQRIDKRMVTLPSIAGNDHMKIFIALSLVQAAKKENESSQSIVHRERKKY